MLLRLLAPAALLMGACNTGTEIKPVGGAAGAISLGQGFDIDSSVLGEARRINVYTPPGYGAEGRRYPVLYLIDGGVDQDFVHIVGLSQYAWVSGSFSEMIVVGIETKDRWRELAHPATHDAKLKADYPTHGASGRFRRFIVSEVKPWIEQRYRTDGRDAVMGESLAGLFVVETFLKSPGSFDDYAAVDPSLWWDDEALSMEAKGLLERHGADGATIYMAVANEGPALRLSQARVAAALTATPGVTFVFRPMEDERHATIYHRAALEALRLLFAKPGDGG